MKELKDLPNKAGFRFIGVNHFGAGEKCEVRLNPIGCYSVYRISDGSPCWFDLVGWMQLPTAGERP